MAATAPTSAHARGRRAPRRAPPALTAASSAIVTSTTSQPMAAANRGSATVSGPGQRSTPATSATRLPGAPARAMPSLRCRQLIEQRHRGPAARRPARSTPASARTGAARARRRATGAHRSSRAAPARPRPRTPRRSAARAAQASGAAWRRGGHQRQARADSQHGQRERRHQGAAPARRCERTANKRIQALTCLALVAGRVAARAPGVRTHAGHRFACARSSAP